MSDLERDIRELLDEEVRSTPPPHEVIAAVRRTRRRQGTVIAGGALAAVALIAASLVALRAIDRADRSTFVDQPTVTTSLNGITMSHPEGWYVVDPDEAGLNGPDPTRDLPKLMLAVAPFDPGELFGCPGMAQGTPHQFLMTIQEEALALSGAAATTWPVELEPLGVDAAESGCYPEWEFQRAGWTAAGRTFEARVGFAPDVRDADREALFAAFASMTFESVADGSTSVVLATGNAGGEDWELIATGGPDGLELMLSSATSATGTSSATGVGGLDPVPIELQLSSLLLGSGEDRGRVVFGAVPANAVRLAIIDVTDGSVAVPAPEILDVPNEIDADLNAFVLVLDPDLHVVIEAYDDSNRVIATGTVGLPEYPAPTPSPDEVLFRGRTNACFWTLSRGSVGPGQDRFDLAAEDVSVGFVADIGPDAPPLQLASYTCEMPPGGVVVFGVATEAVAEIRWTGVPESGPGGPPDCIDSSLPGRFCVFLEDFANGGEAIALDVEGNEIARASFG